MTIKLDMIHDNLVDYFCKSNLYSAKSATLRKQRSATSKAVRVIVLAGVALVALTFVIINGPH